MLNEELIKKVENIKVTEIYCFKDYSYKELLYIRDKVREEEDFIFNPVVTDCLCDLDTFEVIKEIEKHFCGDDVYDVLDELIINNHLYTDISVKEVKKQVLKGIDEALKYNFLRDITYGESLVDFYELNSTISFENALELYLFFKFDEGKTEDVLINIDENLVCYHENINSFLYNEVYCNSTLLELVSKVYEVDTDKLEDTDIVEILRTDLILFDMIDYKPNEELILELGKVKNKEGETVEQYVFYKL